MRQLLSIVNRKRVRVHLACWNRARTRPACMSRTATFNLPVQYHGFPDRTAGQTGRPSQVGRD